MVVTAYPPNVLFQVLIRYLCSTWVNTHFVHMCLRCLCKPNAFQVDKKATQLFFVETPGIWVLPGPNAGNGQARTQQAQQWPWGAN